jgi:hypothetical protein
MIYTQEVLADQSQPEVPSSVGSPEGPYPPGFQPPLSSEDELFFADQAHVNNTQEASSQEDSPNPWPSQSSIPQMPSDDEGIPPAQ